MHVIFTLEIKEGAGDDSKGLSQAKRRIHWLKEDLGTTPQLTVAHYAAGPMLLFKTNGKTIISKH